MPATAKKIARTVSVLAFVGLAMGALAPALAQEARRPVGVDRAEGKFIGIDLDNRTVYYNGRNSGRYCIYKTQPVYNRATGYVEYHRFRRCGRGLYL